MPRFSLKTMLIAVAVVALWFSTFANYIGAKDVRHSIMLMLFVASVSMTYYSQERRRAFWLGVVTVMLTMGGSQFYQYTPSFGWADIQSQEVVLQPWQSPYQGPQQTLSDAAFDSIRFGGMLIFATAAGCIAVYIYDQSRKTDDK